MAAVVGKHAARKGDDGRDSLPSLAAMLSEFPFDPAGALLTPCFSPTPSFTL